MSKLWNRVNSGKVKLVNSSNVVSSRETVDHDRRFQTSVTSCASNISISTILLKSMFILNIIYHILNCAPIRSNCSLFAARLFRYTSAYSLVVRYCSKSSRHRYRKTKIKRRLCSKSVWSQPAIIFGKHLNTGSQIHFVINFYFVHL